MTIKRHLRCQSNCRISGTDKFQIFEFLKLIKLIHLSFWKRKTISHNRYKWLRLRDCIFIFQQKSLFVKKRIEVEKFFALHGVRMALSNRAHYVVSSSAPAAATAIQKMLDANAVLIDFIKCNPMISRKILVEIVGFQTSFNSKNDGCCFFVENSSRSAAAITAYDWLNFATESNNKTSWLDSCSIYIHWIKYQPIGSSQKTRLCQRVLSISFFT